MSVTAWIIVGTCVFLLGLLVFGSWADQDVKRQLSEAGVPHPDDTPEVEGAEPR